MVISRNHSSNIFVMYGSKEAPQRSRPINALHIILQNSANDKKLKANGSKNEFEMNVNDFPSLVA